MCWGELRNKLKEVRKEGWSWCVGHAHGDFYATLWKNKPGIQKVSWSGKQGRHVISCIGKSPEDALEKVLSRHADSQFDPEPPKHPPRPKVQGK